MKHRFAVTLLAVAIASLSASAFAVAPVITDFRSPVIADDTPATNSNDFVYPDAIDLNSSGNFDPDGTVTTEEIKWSFFEAGTPTYRLNSRQSLNLATDDPNAPGTKEVGAASLDDPEQADNDPRTVTFRNYALSPWDGPGSPPAGTFPDNAANGGNVGPQILTAQTKLITLFASDGQAYSTKTLLVYTENKGVDHLSGPEMIIGTPEIPSPTTGWLSENVQGATLTFDATGVCIQTPLEPLGFGVWRSPYAELTLVQNAVYRVRVNVESTAPLAAGLTPLWDFVIDNVNANANGSLVDGSRGKYSMVTLNWDTNGSKNSVGLATEGRREFDLWYAPLPVSAADWNDASTGAFSATEDPHNDGRLLFRVLDVPGPINAETDQGTLCLKSYRIDRVDIDQMTVAENVFDEQDPVGEARDATKGFTNPLANITVGSIVAGSTTIVNDANGITVTPTTPGVGTTPPAPPTVNGSWYLEIVEFDLGDDNVDFGTGSTLTDNWPIDWADNQLMRITVGGQAPNALGQSNPPDAIRVGMDAPTSELSTESILSAGANLLGMPKEASVTTYTAFHFTQNKTGAATPEFQKLRPRVSLLNIDAILSGGTNVNNGGFRLTFIKVDRMNSFD